MLRQSLSILKQLGSTGKSQDATDLLHEDLALVEQRVEPAKKAAQVLHKKLHACLQSPAGLDAEKRMVLLEGALHPYDVSPMSGSNEKFRPPPYPRPSLFVLLHPLCSQKKLPLMLLSISMAESLKDFDAESSIRRVLEMCCFMEKMLANIVADFEMKVEKEVLEPLNKLSDDDLPEILRNKKLFAKLTTDWQNVRNKCQASTGPQAKQDGLKEEVEEAWRKLENMKDQYSADLYHFASKEDDYANYFICLLELQAEYHKRSHEFLERNITELKENHSPKEPSISLSMCKVYGQPLLSHLSEGNTEIAVPIQECVHMLLRTGMKEEGLFRLAAAASVVKRLKNCLDRGAVDHSEFSMDPHAVAGALKCYLRELPEPLMTFELYEDWFKAAGEKELTDKLEKLKVLLKKLPLENYNNLRYLVQFLSLLSEEQAVNRMTPSNIAIVLGPNLLWPRAEGQEATFDMASASSVQVVMVVEPLIQYSSSVFPEAVSFEIPEPPASPDMTTPVIHPFLSEKEKLTRTASASSTASSCSSYHTALSKSNSTASQDSSGYSLVKSGSVSRGGMTTWETVAPEPAAPTSHSPTSVHESQMPTPSGPESSGPSNAPSPTPAPRSSVSSTAQAKNPTQKQHGEQGQLEPILEAGPNSPGVTVKITTSFKPPTPKKPFNQHKTPGQLNKHVVVHYSRPKAPVPPGPKVPADAKPQPEASSTSSSASSSSSMSTSTAQTSVPRKTNVKRPGVRAPKCPPPLPPPQVPSVAQ